jgi:hypothetical protein
VPAEVVAETEARSRHLAATHHHLP